MYDPGAIRMAKIIIVRDSDGGDLVEFLHVLERAPLYKLQTVDADRMVALHRIHLALCLSSIPDHR